MCDKAFQDLFKSFVSFGGNLDSFNEEMMGRQQIEELK